MGEENKIRDAADAIKGVAEAVPVYQDVVQPAAKEVGKALQTIAKTVHIALAPVSVMVWGYEKISEYLDRTLTEKLKDVPPEQIVPPNPAIAGPAVEALRFAASEPNLRELYANLLATSMDSHTASSAHPAFVDVIRQLVGDEARIINFLASREAFTIDQIFGLTPDHVYIPTRSKFLPLATITGCSLPDLMITYMSNLERLGLIDHSEVGRRIIEWADDNIPYYRDKNGNKTLLNEIELVQTIESITQNELKNKGYSITAFAVHREVWEFTSFGCQFVNACIIREPK